MVALATATGARLVAALAAGKVGSAELLEACLARVAAYNDGLNAVVATDLDRARAEARAADDARARGRPLGPLHGLPMTVKDVFETAGLRTTAGAAELAEHVPARDADAVARLRAAGAIVYGKTNVPRYAGDFQTWNERYGLTVNPWRPDRTAGGSSGGSAVAVAAGMSPIELGSDIAGSIRAPAHYCGVFGHLPSWGAVPGRGHLPPPPGALATPELGTAGPLGRGADDLELALDVLVGADLAGVPGGRLPANRLPELRGCRVGLWLDSPLARTDRELLGILRRLADRLADAGAVLVERLRPPRPFYEMHEVYVRLLIGVLSAHFTPDEYGQLLAVGADDPLAQALTQSYRDWAATQERRARIEAAWPAVFDQVDVVLTPVTPLPAFPHDLDRPAPERMLEIDGRSVPYFVHMVWTNLASLARLPATVVPVGHTAAGLPVGAQIIGARWDDRSTIGFARLVERLTGGFVAPPLPAGSAAGSAAAPPDAESAPARARTSLDLGREALRRG
ncbi:amidase [Micromonospora sp. S4605]|uniref:amidase n=1 Tax=Micromonospora sp. S4605 TaxID=1420897 RepID=UPI000D6FF036|nr:amidase [Micromonospora sp. S4605]PWU50577.1 amidase [Micromonospora sp. S4605]